MYKGYSLHKETEEYLASRGLKDPLYTMHAADLKEDLFGALVPCPFQVKNLFLDIIISILAMLLDNFI